MRPVLAGVWAGLLLAGGAAAAAAAAGDLSAEAGREVFVTVGEHGEVSFSDVASPGAERRTLPPVTANDDALADLESSIRQTLDVARALEESRLAREQARAEARAAAAPPAAPPVVYVEERYAPFPYVYAPHRFPRHPHQRPPPAEPPDSAPPPEKPRSRPFVWRND